MSYAFGVGVTTQARERGRPAPVSVRGHAARTPTLLDKLFPIRYS